MLATLKTLSIREKLFISVLFPAAILLAALEISSSYYEHLSRYVDNKVAQAQEDLDIAHQYSLFESWNLRFRLNTIRDEDVFNHYILSPTPENKASLEAAWQNISHDNLLIKRMIFLNTSGIEKVRVDFNVDKGSATVVRQYEDKSSYSFFNRAVKRKSNRLFYHSLDLLVEDGHFVKPYEVAFRMIKPVLVDKKRVGYLVLYVDTKKFDREIQANLNSGRKLLQLDAHGFYLEGQNPEHLYGGELAERNNFNIRKDHPELWQLVLKQKQGVWKDCDDIYVFGKFDLSLSDHQPFYVIYYKMNKKELAQQAFKESKSEIMLLTGFWLLILLLCLAFVLIYLSQKKRISAKLYQLAYYDPLTHLYNRVRFEKEIEIYTQADHPVTLIFVDLHELRQINDSYSYQVGNDVLIEIGKRLKSFEHTEIAARVADNGFAILLEGSDKIKIVKYAGMLQERLSQPIIIDDDYSIRIMTTLGIARLPNDGQTPTELLLNANTAANKLRFYKDPGFTFYQKSFNTKAINYLKMRNYIEEALEKNYFYLVYLPKIHFETQRVVGLEACIRMKHPVEGEISPEQFLPVAETSGLLHKINLWIIEEACQQGRNWLNEGKIFGTISVHTSKEELQDPEYFTRIRHLLNEIKFPANYLKIKITEQMVMGHCDISAQNLQKLNQFGIFLSIDNFGAGYSSFSYINNLPIKEIRIDRSFIDNLQDETCSEQLVQAIIATGQALDIDVIAECVEKDEQLGILKDMGCDIIQEGYYKTPLLPADLGKWL